jgi:hypothetical protein
MLPETTRIFVLCVVYKQATVSAVTMYLGVRMDYADTPLVNGNSNHFRVTVVL